MRNVLPINNKFCKGAARIRINVKGLLGSNTARGLACLGSGLAVLNKDFMITAKLHINCLSSDGSFFNGKRLPGKYWTTDVPSGLPYCFMATLTNDRLEKEKKWESYFN